MIEKVLPGDFDFCKQLLELLDETERETTKDNGFGIINGSSGFLGGNVSEFRETTSYYIYLLYAIQSNVCLNYFLIQDMNPLFRSILLFLIHSLKVNLLGFGYYAQRNCVWLVAWLSN